MAGVWPGAACTYDPQRPASSIEPARRVLDIRLARGVLEATQPTVVSSVYHVAHRLEDTGVLIVDGGEWVPRRGGKVGGEALWYETHRPPRMQAAPFPDGDEALSLKCPPC